MILDNWLCDKLDFLNKVKIGYYGLECDGGFVEYIVLFEENVIVVILDFSDVELVIFFCFYFIVEGMLICVNVGVSDIVFVSGVFGGVGGVVV